MILESPLLLGVEGVRHAFSTRLGGVSADRFATMNLARTLGDHEPHVAENRARLLALARMSAATQLVEVDQVHGTRVLEIVAAPSGATLEQADGMFTGRSGLALGVRTADCAPILIAGVSSKRPPRHAEVVAAVHAGWRGATAGILVDCLKLLEEAGAGPGALRIAIGPTIGLDAFEVGDEVIAAAERSLDGATPPVKRGPSGKWHLDLRELLVAQLSRAGVAAGQIDRVGGCTVAAPSMYFSHRRDAGKTGRHLSLIALERA